MPTTARLEMRIAPERAELIRQAAAARGESVTNFVLDAATKAAEEELSVQRETIVPAGYFDHLLSALDTAGDPPERLVALAREARAFDRA